FYDRAETMNVTFTSNASGVGSATSSNIVVSPAATSKFLVSGFPSPVTAGVAPTFTVTAEDAFGNTTPAYQRPVHLMSSDAQAALPADYAFTGNDAGVHSFGATLKTAGSQLITATDTGNSSITGSQSNISVNPAAATHFRITGPTSVAHGAAFSITVTALDA